MNRYLAYFFGTPKRLLICLIVLGIIFCMICPQLVANAFQALVSAILTALGPLIGPALAVIIVFFVLRMMVFGKKK